MVKEDHGIQSRTAKKKVKKVLDKPDTVWYNKTMVKDERLVGRTVKNDSKPKEKSS